MVQDGPGGAVLTVRVVPRAGRSEVAGVRHGALLVRLAAPPVDDAANDALVALLADRLDVPRRAITIVAGARSRLKRLRIAGMDGAELQRRLGAGGAPAD